MSEYDEFEKWFVSSSNGLNIYPSALNVLQKYRQLRDAGKIGNQAQLKAVATGFGSIQSELLQTSPSKEFRILAVIFGMNSTPPTAETAHQRLAYALCDLLSDEQPPVVCCDSQ